MDYSKLEKFLSDRNWKEAEKETAKVMFAVAKHDCQWSVDDIQNIPYPPYLSVDDIQNIPSQDLQIIDRLWIKYSQGKFGFSVQKQIFQKLGGSQGYNSHEFWQSFANVVGWEKGDLLFFQSDIRASFDLLQEAPVGFFPCRFSPGGVHLTALLTRQDL